MIWIKENPEDKDSAEVCEVGAFNYRYHITLEEFPAGRYEFTCSMQKPVSKNGTCYWDSKDSLLGHAQGIKTAKGIARKHLKKQISLLNKTLRPRHY